MYFGCIEMYSSMYWDVFYDILRCISTLFKNQNTSSNTLQYIGEYIIIHLTTYINTSMMYWDVFNCQYMINTRQFPAQYISSTSVIHPICSKVLSKPQFEIHPSIDVWFIVNTPQIHLTYRENTSLKFFSGTWLGLFTVVCALFGPQQQPNMLGLEAGL